MYDSAQFRNLTRLRCERLLQWQQNGSKATLWQLYELQLFGGAQDIITRLTAVCCMLLPHNPHRLLQHYKRHICGPSCSCKHRVLWISPIFEHYFCLNYMGTVCYWKLFWSRKSFRFKGQCWYFNPQWTTGPAINKASCVLNSIIHWEKWAVTKCLRIYRCL